MLVIAIGVLVFATFAAALAFLYMRPADTMPVRVIHPKRRPF
jgi:hypothetical protein